MKSLGLDISTCTGYAIVEGSIVLEGGEIQNKKLSGIARTNFLADKVLQLIANYRPDIVVLEGYGFSFKGAGIVLVELGTVVRYFLWQEDQEFIIIPPNSLKQFVTGKGNAPKDMMMLEVYKKWGYSAATNNVADAVSLAMVGQCYMGEMGFPEYSIKACEKIIVGK